jgi:hypothetical protein
MALNKLKPWSPIDIVLMHRHAMQSKTGMPGMKRDCGGAAG